MNWCNYHDVLQQLRSFGLLVESLEIGSPKPKRCRVEGKDREARGWYRLDELVLDGGDIAIVGNYGVWHGANANSQRVELRLESGKKRPVSDEQRAALKARIAADRKAAEDQLRLDQARAAARAERTWRLCAPEGESAYLRRKGVAGHGVRYSPKGAVVIPLLDFAGKIHGLQIIHPVARRDRDKDFWPKGIAKVGHFFALGPTPTPGAVVLIGEGYATAASAFEATGFAAFVAWDAGNLPHVATVVRKRYPKANILLLADDDFVGKCDACHRYTLVAHDLCAHCGEPHRKTNAGILACSAAALAVGGQWLAPAFLRERAADVKGPTDFNDLHHAEGLHAVRAQIDEAVRRWGWHQDAPPRLAARMDGAGEPHDASHHGSGGQGTPLRPIEDESELHERFSLVYEIPDACFDGQEHILVPLASMKNACTSRAIHRGWMDSPAKRIVRKREVDFDPSGERADIRCNLWGGWPTEPREGECESILELLYMLCSEEPDADATYRWVLRWLAYPIQHPGAKMKTALVFHGPQGTGKNLFFEAVKAIYGPYGGMIDQAAIEDKFNDYASRKLFLIADEVVARAELYHVANRLKSLITGDTIRINPKNHGAYEETNHLQLVFLSNGVMPLVVEKDDRRYCVVWTPPKQDTGYYARVRAEIARGGIAALHHHLLHLPLGDFDAGTLPPLTEAKKDLVELSLDSTERFWEDWTKDRLPLSVLACRVEDLYDAYRHWCLRNGVAKAPQLSTFVGATVKRPGCHKDRVRHLALDGSSDTQQSSVIWPRGRHPAEDLETRTQAIVKFHSEVGRYRDLRRDGSNP